MTAMTYAEAARLALQEEMARDPKVWALGEDLGYEGGMAGQYDGLQAEFGSDRIVDTPISESTIMGAAVGAALAGTRPVAEMRFSDFAMCAVSELVNQAAKARYMFGGQARVPLVARMPIGIRGGIAAQHSQSPEAWYVHTPGLVVVTPSTAADNRGLLKSAIRCDDPVVYMEHKGLWGVVGEVDEDDEEPVPLGVAAKVCSGDDITIVSWAAQIGVAALAADALVEDGISAEVIDLRTLYPWDRDAVMNSAARTGRLLVVHEAVRIGGFGGEIASDVAETLGIPVARLGGERIPIPFSVPLEDAYKIKVDRIVARVRELVA
ncbi:MAG: alpha-ketoacid dehydrogenase subunit beta [Alphaproteobacteria bacterium]|nr:alpha-ketoacid dehydrogenase subunit beta [Alphaproteobacteria bacterium]HCP00040.1 alpha-ketoacid dehydrogenase subunit beta [Rhodospirillaceae bacterium]